MADIIDLRKRAQTKEAEKGFTLQWSSREYEKKARSTSWYIGTGAIAAVLVIFGILGKSYFFIIFVALAYAVFMMYEKKIPPEFSFAISAEGVSVGNKLHVFPDLKSFWIFSSAASNEENSKELSLETDKTLMPHIHLPLKNIDPEQVRSFLLNYLPEKEHQEFVTDQIERSL